VIGITVLGSTGTIGVNTLDVVARHPDRYKIIALTANRNVAGLLEQCKQWQPEFAVVADADFGEALQRGLADAGLSTEAQAGSQALANVSELAQTDYVMAGIVGAAGLLPSLAAARAGKRVLLANKESLVMSGQLFMDAVHDHGAQLLPIDSEHNALFQCMPADAEKGLAAVGVSKILLTASGGPFRTFSHEALAEVTPEQACAHPNWVMGRKISVDSATMMNKGLEIIEACWLFDTSQDNVEVVIHPQSVVHSLVEYVDGSVLAQLGNPDMRTPIAHSLAWPERIDSGVGRLSLTEIARLDFEPPDTDRFPCLQLARDALSAGGTSTAILNAANEIAVAAFLERRIGFTDIPRLNEAALEEVPSHDATSLQVILSDDQATRDFVTNAIETIEATVH
jgi:1-deoxy-D-xylulose-5-phosphate reductoisomerase